ncbi:MAG: DNA cytosine methyltransferase [Clostridiales bacterium]|nr:DNA cytosine methyltransferase [Clostridiales bacterium]
MKTELDLLTVPEIARKLKVTPQYVRRLINEKKLEANRIGSQWIVSPEQFKQYILDYNVIIEPDDHKRVSDEIPKIVALSFFSGAMGLDIGMANGGIKAILACELNKYCRMTIQNNEPEIGLIGDINKYNAKDILRMANLPENQKIDVIFGGPPCQAFSTAGARRALNDERGNVFLRYIDIVKELKPTYVIIENVRGLLSAPYPYDDVEEPIKGGALCVILDRLKSAGYTISFELYNAANFGAPQIRERIIMIGKLGDEKVSYLQPTHTGNGDPNLSPWITLKDALSVLPSNIKHHYIEFPEKRLKFYRMLKEGQYWKDLPPAVQKEAMGQKLHMGGGKTGFYRRLSYSKPSPTLVTNPTMPATDLCHPTEDRPLSVEEYGCIQGFPLDWVICGPILEQYKQIGNAVPIKLGEAIARTIIADMNGEKYTPPYGYKYSRYANTSDVTWRIAMNSVLEKKRAIHKYNIEQLSFDI